METKLDLSIIIINFKTAAITSSCLSSIYQFTKGITFEVIVVDNASGDDSVSSLKKLQEKYKNLHIIISSENNGFGAGNNLGAKTAKGQYLLFLNSDTLLTENNLPYCLEQLKKLSNVGVYSCRLSNQNGSIQPSGGYFPNLLNLFAWQLFFDDLPFITNLFKSIHPHNSAAKPEWVTGAFMIIPNEVFKKVNGFDEKIFMYSEELELCYRINKLGFQVIYDPKTSIVHLGGASGGAYLALTKEVEGMIYFWQKHKPANELPLVKATFWFGSLLRYVIFGIIMANANARKSYKQILGLLS